MIKQILIFSIFDEDSRSELTKNLIELTLQMKSIWSYW
jgi:hypothetical protein